MLCHIFTTLTLSVEMSRKLRGVREKTERQNFKKQTIGHGGGAGGGRPSDKGSTILLEPGDGTVLQHK